MNIIPITSFANPLVKKVRGLHVRSQREKNQLFLLEGVKLVNEALDKNIAIQEIIVSSSFLKEGRGQCLNKDITSFYVVDDKLFAELTNLESPEGIIATAPFFHFSLSQLLETSTNPLVVLLVAIQDPGNLGTILRTAVAASATLVVLTKGTVDPYSPKVVRSASGAHFSLPIVQETSPHEAIAKLKKHGLKILLCEPQGNKPYWDSELTKPLALVFGNEGQGFAESTLSLADEIITIPMNSNCESLNVAVSAGIILFRAHEKRLLGQS